MINFPRSLSSWNQCSSMFSWNQFLSSSSNPNHSIFSLASDLHLLLGKSSSSFRFPPLLLHSETSPNEGVLKQTGPARPPPLPPPPQFCEIPATTSPSPPSDPEKREETLKPKLKPLHWDKVRASSSHVMVLDQTKSNSFQVNEEMIETLSELMIQVQEQEMSETQRAEMQWSPIMLTYGFPLAIIGMALKYAELKPVPCLSYADAVKLRESSATPILTQEPAKVELGSLFMGLTINNIIRMLAGKRYYGDGTEDDDESKHVRDLIAEVIAAGGAGNAADYFPILCWLTDYEKRVKKLGGRVDEFLQSLVDEKRAEKVKGNTMIDRLLSLQETQPEYYTDVIIKGIIEVMILAGTDTSAATLEWAMSNLLNHPEVLKKAKTEIDEQIGLDRLIEEQDIVKLPYLQSIVSETLRLYPVVPMLLPHMASKDCMVADYDVPRKTILLVNVWAIHRDPKMWEEPEKFKPERFEKEGEDKKLMSFGMGRRACPGLGLGQRLVTLALGLLVQCFEWERTGEEYVDMTEAAKGITMHKSTSLEAMCRARPIVDKILDASNSCP